MLRIESLTKVFLTDAVETTALDRVDFAVKQGGFIASIEPSGCRTWLRRMVRKILHMNIQRQPLVEQQRPLGGSARAVSPAVGCLVAVIVAMSANTFAGQGAPVLAKAEKSADEGKVGGPRNSTITGEIIAVDTKGKTLTVKRGNKDTKIFKAAAARIKTHDKLEATLAAVQAGDKVLVACDEKSGATLIKCIGPAGTRAPEKNK
jgi:hypothetical protein